ncbi:MAG: DUF6537 domain-containing protein, partial [Chthoniobacteraceae bacterium]
MIGDYEAIVAELIGRLDAGNHGAAVAIASVPDKIRGFGHVKAPSVAAAHAEWATLLAAWRTGKQAAMAAA